MTDAQHEKQKERVKKLVSWIKMTGLKYWDIDVEYQRTPPDSSEKAAYESPALRSTVMVTEADFWYQRATITVYTCNIEPLSDATLEADFVHELMHCFLNPLSHKSRSKEEELVATQLAKAFIWVRDITEENAKKKGKTTPPPPKQANK